MRKVAGAARQVQGSRGERLKSWQSKSPLVVKLSGFPASSHLSLFPLPFYLSPLALFSHTIDNILRYIRVGIHLLDIIAVFQHFHQPHHLLGLFAHEIGGGLGQHGDLGGNVRN